jgi:tetratricopeptide (TPR) repeat protein
VQSLGRFFRSHMRVVLGLAVVLALSAVAPAFAAPSPSREILSTQKRLAELLRRGDFDALDATIARLQDRYDSGAVGEELVVSGYLPFAPAEWDIAARLDSWVTRAPDRFQARLARGLYHYEFGMLSRGARRDEDVGAERVTAMREAYARATRDFQVALAARPRLPAAWRASIDMAAEMRDSFELSHSYRAAVAALPHSFAVRIAYIHALWRFDAPTALKRFAEEIVARRPGTDERFGLFAALPAYYEAASLIMRDDPGAAIEFYNESLSRYDWPRARIQRALALFDLSRIDEAEADLRAAIAARPWSGDAYFWLGTVMLERGDKAQGRKLLDQAIALEPMNPVFRSARATQLTNAGQTSRALHDLDMALVFGADNAHVHAARAAALIDSDPQGAMKSIEIMRHLDPDSAPAQLLYVNALYSAHDCSARLALTRYVSLCENSGSCGDEVRYWDGQIRQMRCQAP